MKLEKKKVPQNCFPYLDYLAVIGLRNCCASARLETTSPRCAPGCLPSGRASLTSARPAKTHPWRFPSPLLLCEQLVYSHPNFLAK